MADICAYEEEFAWAHWHLEAHCGSFLECFCKACLQADGYNYELLRPVVAELMVKYPKRED